MKLSSKGKRKLTETQIEGKVQDVRDSMVVERQKQMAEIERVHDEMIREKFHMERFKYMTLYDPEVAKQDNSPVFQEYKAQYDLIDQVSMNASPSRATRRAQVGLRQNLTSTSSSPYFSVSARPSSIAGPSTPSPRKKFVVPTSPASPSKKLAQAGFSKSSEALFSPKASKNKINRVVTSNTSFATSPLTTPHVNRSTKGSKAVGSLSGLPESISAGRITIPRSTHVPPRKRRRLGSDNETDSGNVIIGRKAGKSVKGFLPTAESASAPDPVPRKMSSRLASRYPSTSSKALPSTPETAQKHTRALLTPSPVKKITLVVRPPPRLYSNPQQIPQPQPPEFNGSLSRFLSSYRTVDGEDVSDEEFSELVEADASTYAHANQLRVQGRLVPGGDILFGDQESAPSIESLTPARTSEDIWDRLLEEVEEAVTARQKYVLQGGRERAMAGQVSAKIQGHLGAEETKRMKETAVEERRIRILARSTLKLVLDEWKKAIYHIREQERLRHEEIELRLGQTHLDAILDQSGQILETQHVDLRRHDGSRYSGRSSDVSSEDDFFGDSDDEEDDGGSKAVDDCDDPERTVEDEQFGHLSQADSDDEDIPLHDEEDIEESQTLDDLADTSELLFPQDAHDDGALPDENFDIDTPSTPASAKETPFLASPHIRNPGDDDDNEEEFERSSAIVAKELLNLDSSPQDIRVLNTLTGRVSNGDRSESNDDTVIPFPPIDQPMIVGDVEVVAEDCESQSSRSTPIATAPDGIRAASEQPETHSPRTSLLLAEDIEVADDHLDSEHPSENTVSIPEHLKPFAVAPLIWDAEAKVTPPLLLRGILRPYQQTGLEWLASLHNNSLNGILADEMGLGKTIQTIALLAHLACHRGIWGPHLIVVPTSVLLNWEMEFKKFLPGFKVLTYHGNVRRRKELRQGWTDKYHFNVCITSYTLASKDAHIFKRKTWYYMILDEAHMIKNFKSQRWSTLLMFRSFRRLLLTGTPLQNNLTELWALLQFLLSGSDFADLNEFGEWFSNPLERAIEMGKVEDDDTQQRVSKLHTVLRPYLLRRLKRDVEKELPSKYEHLVLCPLSKRQRFLYDEFMARANTRDALHSGVYQRIANILMQLRKVCNHPDLFEVRPIVTSFAMERSAIADFEVKELLVRRRWLESEEPKVNLDVLGLQFIEHAVDPFLMAAESRRLSATFFLPCYRETLGMPPPKDNRTIEGYRKHSKYQERLALLTRWGQKAYLNHHRCCQMPVIGAEIIRLAHHFYSPLVPFSEVDWRRGYLSKSQTLHSCVSSFLDRAEQMSSTIDRFAFVTPAVVAPRGTEVRVNDTVSAEQESLLRKFVDLRENLLHRPSVKLQIAFPDSSLLQYDCGKLQVLTKLLREKKRGGHRCLIFTQMTRILDILEIFLNLHGYLYLRLDGSTKIEDRQYVTERFNADPRVFCFIASSRSGGVGINLTGADTVIFYDSDFNPQMDRQCEDRAHRIGQIRDVHIYRFVSEHTVEEALLRKANQKRSLDDLVIQRGNFDWRSLFGLGDGIDNSAPLRATLDEGALTRALGEFEDSEDRDAAAIAANEEGRLEDADEADFGLVDDDDEDVSRAPSRTADLEVAGENIHEENTDGDGTTVDYMLAFVERDPEFFKDWRL